MNRVVFAKRARKNKQDAQTIRGTATLSTDYHKFTPKLTDGRK